MIANISLETFFIKIYNIIKLNKNNHRNDNRNDKIIDFF
jgi:hypothetical protein